MSNFFSSDSHIVEPPEVFNGLEARFGDRAPSIVTNPNGQTGTFKKWGNELVPVGRMGIAGRRLDDPETQKRIERGYEGFEPGIMDPAARLDDQAVDGVSAEILYPSLNIDSFGMAD